MGQAMKIDNTPKLLTLKEVDNRIAEKNIEVLAKAEKRFAALAKVEKRHADAYQSKLENL